MHKTLERIHRQQGRRAPRKTSAELLRTQIWLDNILDTHQISLDEFEQRIRGEGDKSTLPERWRCGDVAVSRNNINKVERRFPGSKDIYDLELYELLAGWGLSRSKAQSLIKQYKPKSLLESWHFPNNGLMRSKLDNERLIYAPVANRIFPEWYVPNDGCNGQCVALSYVLTGTNSFVQRSDIFAFIAVLGLARISEAENNTEEFISKLCDAYRIFPAIARLRVFKKYWRALFELLHSLRQRSPIAMTVFKVDEPLIEEQIYADVFITERHCQPRDPITDRFIPNLDPIIYAKLMF